MSIEIQYRYKNKTKSQKFWKDEDGQLQVKTVPITKKLLKNLYLMFNVHIASNVIGLNLMKGTIVKNVKTILINENTKSIKKVLRQDRLFSTRLLYAKKKIGEVVLWWIKNIKR